MFRERQEKYEVIQLGREKISELWDEWKKANQDWFDEDKKAREQIRIQMDQRYLFSYRNQIDNFFSSRRLYVPEVGKARLGKLDWEWSVPACFLQYYLRERGGGGGVHKYISCLSIRKNAACNQLADTAPVYFNPKALSSQQ